MKSELKQWTWNAKTWRIDNGYTTIEWEMYAKNVVFGLRLYLIIGVVFGFIMGYIL